jgi:hypothetical protein
VPVDVSVPFRRGAVEVVGVEDDFEGAAAADQMWKAFGAAAAGMHSHPDFGLAKSRVFARRETHITGEDELATAAAHRQRWTCRDRDAIVPWLWIYKAKASREGERCAFHDWC